VKSQSLSQRSKRPDHGRRPRPTLPPSLRVELSDVSVPRRLRENARDIASSFETIGNLSLLNQPTIAIIGSRHSSDKGLNLAARIAAAVAEIGGSVASGYAKGVDTAAHLGALRAQGTTIFVLPFGIAHFTIKTELREYVSSLNFLAVSQFPSRQPWFASAAMKRNRLICAIADAVVVVEAGESGGTVDGARVAVEMKRPLYVVRYSSAPPSASGNEILLSQLPSHPLSNWRDVSGLVERLRTNSPNLVDTTGLVERQEALF
jgi:DNA processing protein